MIAESVKSGDEALFSAVTIGHNKGVVVTLGGLRHYKASQAKKEIIGENISLFKLINNLL